MYSLCSGWQARSERKIRRVRALPAIGRAAGGARLSIFDTVLHIPAEQRPFVPPRTLTRVTLPLTARLGLRFAVAVLGSVVVSLACVALAVVLAGADGDALSRVALAAVFAVAALVPAGVATTAIVDALSQRPVLTLDPEGMLDTRMHEGRIAWHEISAAAIVGSVNGIAAVRLTLAAERAPRYNPFRIGGWTVEWRRRRCDRLVALSLLDQRPHDLAQTIVMLAARHGVTIEQDPPLLWP